MNQNKTRKKFDYDGPYKLDQDGNVKVVILAPYTETYTITFGDRAENGVGMQQIGEIASEGFNLEDLENARDWFINHGIKTELHDLNKPLVDLDIETDPAYILVARKGLGALCGEQACHDFHREQARLPKDSKMLQRGKLVNKLARHNLCFGEESQEPDYQSGMGRIIAFSQIPLLEKTRETLGHAFGEKGTNLFAEGNYYYDLEKCGIGFHGDTERRKVVAIRTGATFPLHFQWFLNSRPVGEKITFEFRHGDVYALSEKAVGTDWKKKKIYTVRHAAGWCKRFLAVSVATIDE